MEVCSLEYQAQRPVSGTDSEGQVLGDGRIRRVLFSSALRLNAYRSRQLLSQRLYSFSTLSNSSLCVIDPISSIQTSDFFQHFHHSNLLLPLAFATSYLFVQVDY